MIFISKNKGGHLGQPLFLNDILELITRVLDHIGIPFGFSGGDRP